MQAVILPPENQVAAKRAVLKLRHLPLVMVYLGGSIAVLGVLAFGAIVFEAALALLVFLLIAAVILLLLPVLFLAAYRKQSQSNCS